MPSSGPAQVLVRLHGHPLGIVQLSSGDTAKGSAAFYERVDRELGPAVRKHLDADAIPVPASPLEGALPSSVACRRGASRDLKISVVVNACEASSDLRRTLASIQAQSRPPDELVVVDNRPETSGIPDLLAASDSDASQVGYVSEPVKGLARARNAGLAAVSGDIVVFTDADVVADPLWVDFIASGFEDDGVGAVTGLILPAEMETEPQMLFEEFGGFNKGYARRRFDLYQNRPASPLFPFAVGMYGSGANGAFRTLLLRDLGGFDVALGTGTVARGGEDLDVYLRIIQAGEGIVYEPGAIIWHSHHRRYEDLRRQIYNYGVGLGAMMAKHMITSRRERLELLRLGPACARHMLDPRSPKNAKKGTAYPRSLTLLELAGVVHGPFAYLASRRHA